jgi:hypothetical protein
MSDMGVDPSAAAARATNPALTGIGGWLILPLLGLIGTVIVQLLGLASMGDSFALASQLQDARGTLVIGEVVGNLLVFLVAPAVLLVLMVQKKRSFPRLFILYTVVSAAFFLPRPVAGLRCLRRCVSQRAGRAVRPRYRPRHPLVARGARDLDALYAHLGAG